jgi:two-component system chemotaxis response regulator CheB
MDSVPPAIVVIGASTGGYDALKRVLIPLPPDFPLPILVVMHIGMHDSHLPGWLSMAAQIPVRYAEDGEHILPGAVLVAPPDRHLIVRDGVAAVVHGPKENFCRPAIDPLFRSAAQHYGAGVIGVILTGDLDDGTVGLQAIKAYGGIAVVQAPQTAQAPSMPSSALRHVEVDCCAALDNLGSLLLDLSKGSSRALKQPSRETEIESGLEVESETTMDDLNAIGKPSSVTCPECHGNLWEIKDCLPQRFRCHVGHAYTARSLVMAQDQMTEEAIWAAARALHEKASLLSRLAANEQDDDRAAEHRMSAERAWQHGEALRELISGTKAERRVA